MSNGNQHTHDNLPNLLVGGAAGRLKGDRHIKMKAIALQPAGGAADQQDRQVVVRVQVAVAHAAAVEEHRVIEQVAVAVRGRLQLLEEDREQVEVVHVDLGFLRDLLGDVVVVRHRVMAVGDADLRIASAC